MLVDLIFQTSGQITISYGYSLTSTISIGFAVTDGQFSPINQFNITQNCQSPSITLPSQLSLTLGLNMGLKITVCSIFAIIPGIEPYVGINLAKDTGCSLFYDYQWFYGINFTLDVPAITIPIHVPILGTYNYTFTFGGLLPYQTSLPIIPQQNMACPQFCGCVGIVNRTALGQQSNSNKRDTDISNMYGFWTYEYGSSSYDYYTVMKLF